jgi:hypothetical protein
MPPDKNQPRNKDVPEQTELYRRMMTEILNTARDWKTERVQPEDLWDAAFREGFYRRLSENPNLASEFLLITERGPTWHYQKYLNMIEDYDDLLALVALSALVNDTLH